MNPDSFFPMAIESQGRSPLLLIGGVVAAVFLGAILGAVGRSLGVPEKVSYTFPLVLGLAALGFTIWYSVAPQGWIRFDSDHLVVEPRMRSARTWHLGTSDPVLRAYELKAVSASFVAGPLMEFHRGDDMFTIGANAPDLASGLPLPAGITILESPDFMVSGEDFVHLVNALGYRLPNQEGS